MWDTFSADAMSAMIFSSLKHKFDFMLQHEERLKQISAANSINLFKKPIKINKKTLIKVMNKNF